MRVLLVLSAALALASPRPAAATAVVVPDDHATIAAALATGADTVWVRDGLYPEVVSIARPLLLARLGPGVPPVVHPNVTGLEVALGTAGQARVVEFRVLQAVYLPKSFMDAPDLWLDRCVLDSGIVAPTMGSRLRVTGCESTGDVDVHTWSLEFTGNTLTGAGLAADYEAFATITSNKVTGAPGYGISLRDNDAGGAITDNILADCGAGIRLIEPSNTPVERNRVERCAGDGLHVEAGGWQGPAVFTDNVLRDLGGDGLVFGPLGGAAIGNTIERVAGAGIRVAHASTPVWRIAGNRITDTGASGVEAADHGSVGSFAGNTILRTGGLGAMLYNVSRADSNVIGRCREDGLYVYDTEYASGEFSASHNTFYLNGGSGLRVHTNDPGSVLANVGFGNGLYGLNWTAVGAATLACNLGFANFAGNVHGVEPGETDREGNPLFCDLPGDDVHVGPGSAAIFAGCDTAGALGLGCAEVVGALPGPPPAALRADPLPARTSLRFAWPPGAPVTLEVFDTGGARRWRRVAEAWRSWLEWDLRDGRGARLAPGVYFARATGGGRVLDARIVIAP